MIWYIAILLAINYDYSLKLKSMDDMHSFKEFKLFFSFKLDSLCHDI